MVLAFLLVGASAFANGPENTVHNRDGSYEVGVLVDGLKDGSWKSYFENGKIRSEGKFEMGVRTGQWIWYHRNGRTLAVESWKDGIYIEGEYWDKRGRNSDISEALTTPEYPGGIEAFSRMISENIRYPDAISMEGIEGSVLVEFRIGPSGRILNPVVKESVHPALDQEALRVVNLSGKWIPSEFHGVRTTTRYIIPITFALR